MKVITEMQKVALVTGSSRGIGKEIALRLADEVDCVAVHYYRGRNDAEKAVKEIKKKGPSSEAFRADLTKEKEAAALIRKVEHKFGRIDILVNNFGPLLIKPWEKVRRSEWISLFESNLMSALHCIKLALPSMRKRKWGRIINIGYSRAEHLAAFPTIAPYAIAKTGLLILTRTIATSEISSGITVNMVSPGLMEEGMLPPGQKILRLPIGKFKDIAEAALFLVSDKAAAITGTNLIVSGTWKM